MCVRESQLKESDSNCSLFPISDNPEVSETYSLYISACSNSAYLLLITEGGNKACRHADTNTSSVYIVRCDAVYTDMWGLRGWETLTGRGKFQRKWHMFIMKWEKSKQNKREKVMDWQK